MVSKVQEVGGFTGRSPSGIPAFYPDPCWESWERSRTSHSHCSGGSEAVGGAEAEWEGHPWSDSPASPKLCKACEGALGGGTEILGVSRRDGGPTVAWLSAGGGKRPLSERRRGFGGKNSVRPAHPGACGGVGSSPVFLPRGVALNPSGNPPPDPRGCFHPQQLAWSIFSFIILVSSSYSDPAPASRPSLLHWIYGVALERKQACGAGGGSPQNPYKANLNPKRLFCSAVTPGLAGERLLPVLPQIPKVPPQPLLLPGCSAAQWERGMSSLWVFPASARTNPGAEGGGGDLLFPA